MHLKTAWLLAVVTAMSPGLFVAANVLPNHQDEAFLASWASKPRVAVDVPIGTAKVLVVAFHDLQCKLCKATHASYLPVVVGLNATQPSAVSYVRIDFPLDSKCNPSITSHLHRASCEAAAVYRAAREAGGTKGAELTQWLESPDAEVSLDTLTARAAGVPGIGSIQAAFDAKSRDIAKDVAVGIALNVRSVPTYYIGGAKAVDESGAPLTPHNFQLALAYELKKAGK